MSNLTDQKIVHNNPSWKSRGGTLFTVEISGPTGSVIEEMWGRETEENVVEVCCIPFLCDCFAMGDKVVLDSDQRFTRVAAHSGSSVARVSLVNGTPSEEQDFFKGVNGVGGFYEVLEERLVSIHCATLQIESLVKSLVAEAISRGDATDFRMGFSQKEDSR